MSIQERYNTIENKLELMLKDNRIEMQEHKQTIMQGINAHAMEAKKEVHHHIVQLVKVQSALSKSTTH